MLGDQQATVHWLQTQMAQHQLRHSWWGCTANLHLKGHNEVTVATVFRLVKGTSPMNTLSNKGFWKVLDKLNKRYSIFFFSKAALPVVHAKHPWSIERDLRAVEYFATTTDLWSSRIREPYMSLTVNYIDGDYAMQGQCLQTSFISQDHTEGNFLGTLAMAS